MVQRKLKYLVVFLVILSFFGCNNIVVDDSTNNASGGGQDNLNTVVIAPKLSDKGTVVLVKGEATKLQFSVLGSPLNSCSIRPNLPNGLTLENDCTIRGAPTVDQESIDYRVTGRNDAGSSEANIAIKIITATAGTTIVSGTVTYDSVPFKNTTSAALDYDNIVKKKVRGAKVTIEDASGKTLGTTSTDANGFYALEVTGTTVRVRVFAQMYKAVSTGEASWDFQVKDNTNFAEPMYVIDGSYAPLGENSRQTRNLNASSGWGGNSYSSTRAAAPFSILDVVYQSVQKVLTADANVAFPALNIFWSKDNRAGTIISSHYRSGEVALYILGKEDSDTDEYDTAVLAHEWGHYYEDQFSRSDSMGGNHGGGDMLDIRIAFGEGFATALGGIIIDSPYYQDAGGEGQQSTFVAVNLDNGGLSPNKGWFSEASIYYMIYDIYDRSDDIGDTLYLPFSSLHNLLIESQKNTPAFTSIFTYITGLKAQNPGLNAEINAITNNEGIAPINDIYGTGRRNRTINANPLYANLSEGNSVTISPDYSARSTEPFNRLGTYNFVKFTIDTEKNYTITVNGTFGTNLSFEVYKEGSKSIVLANSRGSSISDSGTLKVGTYRMDVADVNRKSGSRLTVTLN